jgi:hypothetical protein
MPSIRIGFSSDFNLVNELVGIGTTLPTARLDVRGQIRSDNASGSGGISTFTEYQGFLHSKQGIGNTVSIAQTTKGNLNSLSGEIVISGEVTIGENTFVAPGRLDSLTVTSSFDLPRGGSTNREVAPEKGSTRFNQDLGQLEFYTGYEWRTVGSIDGSGRGRGVFGGGDPNSAVIDYINITSTGNAINFGTLTAATRGIAGCASNTRGLSGAGYYFPSFSGINNIEYITIASEGNSIDFGDLTQGRGDLGSCSSSTRGLWAGGYSAGGSPSIYRNTIDCVQISTLGNGIDFGDMINLQYFVSGCASSTRGIFISGRDASVSYNLIEFVTISSTGNAITFGELTEAKHGCASLSNTVRGIIAGGSNIIATRLNTIEYINISSVGKSQDFGDLTNGRDTPSGVSNSTRGVFAGGVSTGSPSRTNIIDYITITSSGNAQDFGDLTQNVGHMAAMSDSHGGLGGF